MELISWGLQLLRDLEPQLTGLVEAHPVLFYAVVFGIIFAETGLVFAPLLPGDSLLFIIGVIAAKTGAVSLPFVLGLLIVAAILGDAVNYLVGARLGPAVFRYEKSWLFNKAHLLKAQSFYERWGAKTIVLARFVPIVRTFAPFVAGVGRMDFARFAFYNVIGGVAWVLICVLAGYYLAENAWVKERFELVVIAIVLISVLPMAVEFLMSWGKKREEPAASPPKAVTEAA
ncbi:MAG: VTT domain-containing protein [Gemmataceae bacterium]